MGRKSFGDLRHGGILHGLERAHTVVGPASTSATTLERPTSTPRTSRMPFGGYVANKWSLAWKDQHPCSEYGIRKKVKSASWAPR